MPRIHSNILIYYGCIVKNKILRKHFIFYFISLLATPHHAKDTPIMRHPKIAVSCKYFIGKNILCLYKNVYFSYDNKASLLYGDK
uniref:Uncharacterized protein n=1 Tax=viral metagenome TaxID=1070528 RepID=A0A6C0HAN2_9ZZZZ